MVRRWAGSRLVAVSVVLLCALQTIAVAPPAEAAIKVRAITILRALTVAAEGGSSTYDRAKFKHWIDANGDCQNTRTEVLIAESGTTPTYTSSSHCSVAKGKWFSYYDGATWTAPSDVDIDHIVALKEAWESGARSWTTSDRTRFANDLGYPYTLVAVTDNVNQSKSDKDPAEWLPPRITIRCTYAIQWIQVKYRWRLSVNTAEKNALSQIVTGACGDRLVYLPLRAR
jgi:hypothetical protein